MALTDDEVLGIVEILGSTPSLVDAHITSLGIEHMDRIEDRARTQIGRWDDGAGTKFTKIHPKERNYGVETFPLAIQADIKQKLAALLEWPYASFAAAGMGTLQIG